MMRRKGTRKVKLKSGKVVEVDWRINNYKYHFQDAYKDSFRRSPYWMKRILGESNPLVGEWYRRRDYLRILGYINYNHKKLDDIEVLTPEQIIFYESEIRRISYVIDQAEKQYKEKIEEEILNNPLLGVWDQTQMIIDNKKSELDFKPSLILNQNEKDNDMNYEQMMEWSNSVKESDKGGINFLRLPQGIHCIRVIPDGTNNEMYFRHYTQHDWGQGSSFRSCLCWDYIIDNKDIRGYLAEKGIIKTEDAKKVKRFGCPICSTLEMLRTKVKMDEQKLRGILRTKGRCLMNVFYLYQAYPENKGDKTPDTGLHVWEISPSLNKQIISALGKEAAIEQLEEDGIIELLGVDNGKMLVVQAEGEGIGKNQRKYNIDFKGKRGPIVYSKSGNNPFQKGVEREQLPENFEVYKLQEVEASRFLSYQETINTVKSVFEKLLEQIGYDIPGDDPSDNPLDDNYDKSYADKMLGARPMPKPVPETSKFDKLKKGSFVEDWEDDEIVEKEKKKLSSKKPIIWDDTDEEETENMKRSKKTKSDLEFEEAVPPSDPEEEEVKPKKSIGGNINKRRIY